MSNINPLFIIGPVLLMVVLLGLTMRSIVLRERAMIRQRRHEEQERAAYENRWREPKVA